MAVIVPGVHPKCHALLAVIVPTFISLSAQHKFRPSTVSPDFSSNLEGYSHSHPPPVAFPSLSQPHPQAYSSRTIVSSSSAVSTSTMGLAQHGRCVSAVAIPGFRAWNWTRECALGVGVSGVSRGIHIGRKVLASMPTHNGAAGRHM